MKTRLGENEDDGSGRPNEPSVSFSVELCADCRRDVLPSRARPGLVGDMNRGAAKDMTPTVDPRAERVKRRKSRKHPLRVATRELGLAGAVVLSLDARQLARLEGRRPTLDENCPRCLARQRRRTA